MKNLKLILALPILLLITNCSSSSVSDRQKPEWIGSATRTVDNGYIVYIGSGEEVGSNEAELAAEGMALQDLANECSFVPKGARVEDRYSEKQKNTLKAYAKIAVEFQICEEASKTTDPAQIKLLASAPFTDELKNFEDSIQNNRDEVVDAGIPQGTPSGGSGISSNTQFFVARQYVVYQNQAIIMAPPGAYAPGTPAYVSYTNNVRPVVMHVQTYAAANPQVRANPGTWSSMSGQVRAAHPQSFAQPHGGGQVHPPNNPHNNNSHSPANPRQQRRRHR